MRDTSSDDGRRLPLRRILRAILLAGFAIIVLATHGFVDVDRVRVKMREQPTPAVAGLVRVTTAGFPDTARLQPPFAFIARITSGAVGTSAFSVAVDGATVCERSVAGGASRRIDCAIDVPWSPAIAHDVVVQGPSTGWTLEYLELATHHGNTDGAHYLVVLPAASDHYARPGLGWLLTVGLASLAAILFLPAPPPLPRWVWWLYGVVVGIVVLELGASQISQWISNYRIVLSAGTIARLLVLLFAPRLWVVGQRTPALLKRLWRRFYDAGADVTPRPAAIRWHTRAIVVIGTAAFGAVLLHAQFQQMDGVPDRGDPLFSIWRLGWVYHQMEGDPRALFDANIYHPAPLTLTFSDSILLPSVINAPLLAAGVHPVTAYNVTLLASFLASAFACYLLVEGLTGSTTAGFIAGLLFGFYPFRFEHYAHYELLMGYWMPLSLLALHRFIATTKARYAVLAALAAVAQLYSSMYFAVFYLWIAAVVFGILWGLTRPDSRKILRGSVLAAGLAAVLAFPLARVYTAAHLKERPVEEVAEYSARLSDYLRAHPRSAFWGDRMLSGVHAERALFPGLMIVVLAAIALLPPVGPARVAYVGALALSMELTRGYNSVLYLGLYNMFPFMRGLRAPARASVLVGLALAVLAGFAVHRLVAGRSRAWSAVVVGTLAVLIGVDLYPRLSFEQVWREPPTIYSALGNKHDAVLAEFPMGLSPGAGFTDIPQMYFSVWHWNQIVDGYSGHAPEGYGNFQLGEQSFPSPSSIALLRARGVTHVTVNCALYASGCDTMLKKIDAYADLRLLASETWQERPVRLYALTR